MPQIQNSKQTLDFLGTIGSKDRGDGISMSNVAKALVGLSDFLINTARINMDKPGNVATGGTASSMKAKNIQVNGNKLSQDIEIVSTYKFLDQGVKGILSGQGKYSFKTNKPSKKMAAAILKWAHNRGIRGKVKYTPVSKTEGKNVSLRKKIAKVGNYKSFAYAVATNIKKHGIKPTKFFTNAVRDTEKMAKKTFADAFKLDIIQTIKNG